MPSLAEVLDVVLEGLWITVFLTLAGGALALVISFVSGLLSLSRFGVVRAVNRTFVELFRGTSLLVQLFWLAFALPNLGYQLDLMAVGVVALGLNYGAYGAEVVRGAIQAIPKTQHEATIALSMTAWQRMRLVLLPQAWLGMIPPFTNLWIQLLKGTPLVATILVAEMTFLGREYAEQYFSTGAIVYVFSVLLVIYFLLSQAIAIGMRLLERRAKAGIGEAPPPLFGARRPVPTTVEV